MNKSWGSLSSDVRHTSDVKHGSEEDTDWTMKGFYGKCRVCHSESKNCHNHHTSYDPEKTIVVCAECHWKIHNKDGYHDRLDPVRKYKNPKTGNRV